MNQQDILKIIIGAALLLIGITIATLGGHPVSSGFFTQLGDIGVFFNALMYIFGLIAAFVGLFIVYRTLKGSQTPQDPAS